MQAFYCASKNTTVLLPCVKFSLQCFGAVPSTFSAVL